MRFLYFAPHFISGVIIVGENTSIWRRGLPNSDVDSVNQDDRLLFIIATTYENICQLVTD